MRRRMFLCVVLLASATACAQVTNTDATTADVNVADRMLTPPPISGEAYSVALETEARANYVRYGVALVGAYSDNVLGANSGYPVSDVSYSVWPTMGLDETTTRLHWGLTYSPGFTFYQHTSQRNEADQNALLGFQYRLSPHVTFSAHDNFQKSSSVFNQPNLASGSVSGGAPLANESVPAPLADRLSNVGIAGITYQYSAHDMVGINGSVSNLHYPDAAQVPGLWDSSSQAGSAFYSHRFSHRHYLGAMYQYQRLVSYPSGLQNETRTHGAFLFYTVYPSTRFSMSVFGGPQYADTVQPGQTGLGLPAFSARDWAPAGGASLSWQGRLTSAALSYSHSVSEGGGLYGAVRLDNTSATIRQQFTRTWTGSLSSYYANNNLLGPSLLSNNGHTIAATAALVRSVGGHVSLQAGYTRMHMSYDIPIFAGAPNTNREFVSLSYQFAGPLGR